MTVPDRPAAWSAYDSLVPQMLLGNLGLGAILMIICLPRGWTGLAFAFLALVGLGLASLLSLAIPTRRWTVARVPACVAVYVLFFLAAYSFVFNRLLRESKGSVAVAAPLFFTALAGTSYGIDAALAKALDQREKRKDARPKEK